MASFPYPIYGIITATDSSTPSTRVTLRNDRTGETTNYTSNTSGEYILEAANFASGYMTTDRVTVIVGYGDEEGESSILLSSGTHEINITLTAISDSTDTTYCTIQDVLDELGDRDTDDVSYERVRKIIIRAEKEIDDRAGTAFSSTTATEEIYDWNQYTSYASAESLTYGSRTGGGLYNRSDAISGFGNDSFKLDNTPIISITSLYVNNAGDYQADSWTELTEQEGSGGDFIKYTNISAIRFVNQMPIYGKRRIKITYVYGYATVPKTVERLSILLSVRDVLISRRNKDQFNPVSLSVDGFSQSSSIGSSVSYANWLNQEIERLWAIVGDMIQGHA